MRQEERYIARIQFKSKLLGANGQSFEDLVIRVLQSSKKDFRPVKPQGREGDKKNDGFIKSTGTYFQCYAPEDLTNKEKDTIAKLQSTIGELIEFWKDISPVKEFCYVLNDKYVGVFPSIERELAQIEKTYKIKANPFLCKDIEDEFLALSDNDIIDILGGFLPDYTCINDIDVSAIGEVINHLVNLPYSKPKETFPDDLNFLLKIKFNNLSEHYGQLLTSASHSDYLLAQYFTYNSNFLKEDLKNVFSQLYKEGLEIINKSLEEKSDIVFDYILKKASPRNALSIVNAVLVLMAHYFESCDIFEEPKVEVQQSLFK